MILPFTKCDQVILSALSESPNTCCMYANSTLSLFVQRYSVFHFDFNRMQEQWDQQFKQQGTDSNKINMQLLKRCTQFYWHYFGKIVISNEVYKNLQVMLQPAVHANMHLSVGGNSFNKTEVYRNKILILSEILRVTI